MVTLTKGGKKQIIQANIIRTDLLDTVKPFIDWLKSTDPGLYAEKTIEAQKKVINYCERFVKLVENLADAKSLISCQKEVKRLIDCEPADFAASISSIEQSLTVKSSVATAGKIPEETSTFGKIINSNYRRFKNRPPEVLVKLDRDFCIAEKYREIH